MSSPHIKPDDVVTIRNTFINVVPPAPMLRKCLSDSDLSNTRSDSESEAYTSASSEHRQGLELGSAVRNFENAHVVSRSGEGSHTLWGPVELSGSFEPPSSEESCDGNRRQRTRTLPEGVEMRDASSDATSGVDEPNEEEPLQFIGNGLPSVGSVGHEIGQCRPCNYVVKARGCARGHACDFCHFDHRSEAQPRPGKARRQKCKRLVDTLQAAYGDNAPLLERSMERLSRKSDYMRNVVEKKMQNPDPAPTSVVEVDQRRFAELQRALSSQNRISL